MAVSAVVAPLQDTSPFALIQLTALRGGAPADFPKPNSVRYLECNRTTSRAGIPPPIIPFEVYPYGSCLLADADFRRHSRLRRTDRAGRSAERNPGSAAESRRRRSPLRHRQAHSLD